MNSSYEIQKQVKDNAEDLRTFLSDLASWSGKVNNESPENKDHLDIDKPIPPIRNHNKKRESNEEANTLSDSTGSKVTKRISSFDYAKWDKFDVEKACEGVDSADCEKDTVETSLKLRDEAHYEKERGNRFVKSEKWDDAILCYSKAIKCYPKDATFYANRALCYLKKKQYRCVEADCSSALQLEPDYVKALQRRASARRQLNQLEDALQDLHKALSLEPNNTALKADLAKLNLGGASKTAQAKEPLKWTPPMGKQSASSSASEASTSGSSPATKSTEPSLPPAPVVITPAKKHLKEGQVSVGEEENDIKIKPKTNVQKRKEEPNKNICADGPKRSEPLKQPIRWCTKEGTSIVLPISKPPHRRSKAPLKRLSIKECPNYDVNAELDTGKEESRTPEEQEDQCDGAQTGILTIEKSEQQTQNKVNLDENDLPVPSTSVQFISVWKLIQNNSQLCCKFLKKIPANDLSKIFQDCLESDLFSGIIRTLEMEFIKEGFPVYDYLLGLSKVRRFSMLTMFMSCSDKQGLQRLFEYCQTKNGFPEESVNTLKKIYEL